MPEKRSRVGHKKSRNGCARCKARRVKCDEQRPCLNCTRHEVPCSLEGAQDEGTTPETLPSPAPAPPLTGPGGTEILIRTPPLAVSSNGSSSIYTALVGTAQADAGLKTHPSHAGLEFHHPGSNYGRALPVLPSQVPGSRSQPYFAAGWMQSLKLMHHYTAVVSRTFSKVQGMDEIWGKAIPEMACSNETLMHSLLAVSAMHYASTHPERKKEYEIISAVYQDLALQQFSDQIVNISEANCEALLVIGSFIYMLTMQCISKAPEGALSLSPGEVARSFSLMQGMKNIIDYRPSPICVKSGPLAPLFQTFEIVNAARSGRFQDRLERISALARELTSTWAVINPQSACLLAIESLRSTHSATVGDKSPLASRRVWIWPMTLPQLFIDMFGQRHPVALVILAHYAALVRPFEHPNWAREGWSRNVISMVQRSLEDNARMLEWIAWPLRSLHEETDVDDMAEEHFEASPSAPTKERP